MRKNVWLQSNLVNLNSLGFKVLLLIISRSNYREVDVKIIIYFFSYQTYALGV